MNIQCHFFSHRCCQLQPQTSKKKRTCLSCTKHPAPSTKHLIFKHPKHLMRGPDWAPSTQHRAFACRHGRHWTSWPRPPPPAGSSRCPPLGCGVFARPSCGRATTSTRHSPQSARVTSSGNQIVTQAWKIGWTYNHHGIVVQTQPCPEDSCLPRLPFDLIAMIRLLAFGNGCFLRL